jgi:hypothetical protein
MAENNKMLVNLEIEGDLYTDNLGVGTNVPESQFHIKSGNSYTEMTLESLSSDPKVGSSETEEIHSFSQSSNKNVDLNHSNTNRNGINEKEADKLKEPGKNFTHGSKHKSYKN